MFNFRTATIMFFVLLLVMNLLSISGYPVSWSWYTLLVIAYLGVSVAASFFIRSGFHMKAYCRIRTDEKIVALTFDDGPDAGTTPKVLDMLKQHGAKATFFLIGKKVAGNELLLRRIIDEGHIIGSHSYSHANFFDFYPPEFIRKELQDTRSVIEQASGKKVRLFRPPYGVINPFVKKALQGQRFHVIGFSNRTFDTVSTNPEKVVGRIIKQLSPGDIVVLHDTHPSMDIIIDHLLEHLKQKNYRVVPLDEMLKIDAYENA